MQAPVWATRIVGWRWTPSFALVAGSLAFVGVVVAVVPDDVGAVASGSDRLTRATRSRLGTNATSTLGMSSSSDGETTAEAGEQRRAARFGTGAEPAAPGNVVQSIFHSAPTVELPIEPADPSPQPPPPPPPPPPPTATIYTLPPAPNPPAVPEPPSEPQGITGQ